MCIRDSSRADSVKATRSSRTPVRTGCCSERRSAVAPIKKPRLPKPRSGRPGDRRPLDPRPVSSMWYLLGFFLLLAVVQAYLFMPTGRTVPYSEFKSLLAQDKLAEVTVNDQAIRGQLKGSEGDEKSRAFVTTRVEDPKLVEELEQHNVKYTGEVASRWLPDLLGWILPLLLIVGLSSFFFRRMGGGEGGVMSFARSRGKIYAEDDVKVTFSDVAGVEEAEDELKEIVEFLQNPKKYTNLGGRIPKGVLLVGPPGTGKTLLARAVAGEAHVPFFSLSGSAFVEMFVGVGAARVRDLFSEVRKRSPAIIFIDEVDAIGQRRAGSGAVVANDEREQTLNQLLAEMDGFDPAVGIVVLAATNRPEVLDPALLRPGRFDRQVTIPLPNVNERAAILRVHVRGKRLAPNVDLSVVARGTPGFSGADLANLANEAAIFAVRENREIVTADDFFAARDRIILGRREGSNVLLPEEKHAVVVHESGHAMVAALSEHADPVAKVTILPAVQALGVTEKLPLVERHMYGEDYLYDSLAVRLGGRAAELVVLGQGSTGAGNDLAGATDLATKMVREFGMSAVLGPVGYPEGGTVFLGGGGPGMSSRPYAEATQAVIDGEVAKLLREAESRAVELLKANRAELDALVGLLLDRETVDGSDVYRLAGRADKSAGLN